MQATQSVKKVTPVKSRISKKPAVPKGPVPTKTYVSRNKSVHGRGVALGGRSRRIKNNRRGSSGTRRRRGARSFKSIFKF